MVPVGKKAMLNLGPSPIRLAPVIEASENDMTPRSRRISKNSQNTPKPVRKSPNKGKIEETSENDMTSMEDPQVNGGKKFRIPKSGVCPCCDDFKVHLKQHLKVISISICHKCNLNAPNTKCLANHIKVVHESGNTDDLVHCEVCNAAFNKTENLSFHKSMTHNIINDNIVTNENNVINDGSFEKDGISVTNFDATTIDAFETNDVTSDEVDESDAMITKINGFEKDGNDPNINVTKKLFCTVCYGTGMKTTEDEICDSCDIKFNKVTVTINKVTKCPYCHKYQDDIKDHLKEDQRKKGSCTKCPYSTANLNCLKTHSVQIHEIDKGYLFCDTCDISFSDKKCLEYHIQLAHDDESKKDPARLQCVICLKMFKNRLALTSHRIKGEKSQKYQCHLCNAETFKQICLTNHLTEVHKQNIKCEPCGTCFQTVLSMELHFCTAAAAAGATSGTLGLNSNIKVENAVDNTPEF